MLPFLPLPVARFRRGPRPIAMLLALPFIASGAVSVLVLTDADASELANGLMGYWDFSDDLVNRVVSARDAAAWAGQPVTGLPADVVPAARGGALLLDGASSIQLPYKATRFGQSFAISGWNLRGSSGGEIMTLLGEDNDTTGRMTDDPGAPSGMAIWLGRQRMNSDQPVFAGVGTWRHFVFSLDPEPDVSLCRTFDHPASDWFVVVIPNPLDLGLETRFETGANLDD